MLDLYAGGQNNPLNSSLFEDEQFYSIPADAEDKKIDYAALHPGEVVSTANFNGIFIISEPRKDNYDARKKEICQYVAAVFQAFDRDCPEIFWLSGKCKIRILSTSDPASGEKTACFFLVLSDKEQFTMCAPAWQSSGSIAAGLQRRDQAAAAVLAGAGAGGTVQKVKYLNQWLTEHNQYNTTADLTTIGNEPHECLAALEGRVGTDGPVCDGYSRAFKLLCDRLEIPCVLETGWAQATASSTSEFHMWANVQVDGGWYGVDVTWDDPVVKDFVGPKSGRENENFLLVGADTVVLGRAFQASHIVKNQAAAGGVDFHNGPVLSATALKVVQVGITDGSDPGRSASRQEAVTFLYRYAKAQEGSLAAGTDLTAFRDAGEASPWARRRWNGQRVPSWSGEPLRVISALRVCLQGRSLRRFSSGFVRVVGSYDDLIEKNPPAYCRRVLFRVFRSCQYYPNIRVPRRG